jgi:acetate kinase
MIEGLRMRILVLNSGSSSIKFSIFQADATAPATLFEGELSGIGTPNVKLTTQLSGATEDHKSLDARNLSQAIELVLQTVTAQPPVDAVGYRVVHPGPKLQGHQRITPAVLRDLEAAAAFAPLHDPEALQVIHAGMAHLPNVPHFACFDTVFHATMPAEATTYPLPLEYRDQGVHRYGFHGLSCESIVRQMRSLGELPKRMVIAHLGSGCSVTALRDGRSIDTSMGLTPTGGVVMGTRPGDLDPGVILYLLREQKTSDPITAVEVLLNHASGMVALSGMANDVKQVRKAASEGSAQAVLALKVFTRSITKAIGGFCWLLGGLDAIVFAGGIGEHDAQTRTDILDGLTSLGVTLDTAPPPAPAHGIQQISAPASKTTVFIVPAQEDLMIAVHVERMARM